MRGGRDLPPRRRGAPGAPTFSGYVGIDYSGRGDPDEPCSALRVFRSAPGRPAAEVRSDEARSGLWSRAALARWLVASCRARAPLLVGIDHAFSFPAAYFQRRRVATWDAFLRDFCRHWPTHERRVEVCRPGAPCTGSPDELRLADRWTSSAKSVFLFDVQGSVAKSTHAGLPWLRTMRDELGDRLHFWPFDGWTPPQGRSVVAEVYPSIFRKRFARDGGATADQHDAYAVAEWMRERDAHGHLGGYFTPPLTAAERSLAALEGWILGIA